MPVVYDAAGKAVVLGKELGRGGEGAVWETADATLVAKIYSRPLDRDKVQKLQLMPRAATEEILRVAAWPLSTLHPQPGGPTTGITMPRVNGHREIHQLYNPADRRRYYPNADWSFLLHVAMNCAAAFETVHAAGHVVGDVNQGGVLVSSQGTVRLIDCDSFQVKNGTKTYHCLVGVPHYTPPELQAVNFEQTPRTPHHDAFGVALLLFHLLFLGRHPFAGRYSGGGEMQIERAISEGRFAFSSAASSFQMQPPPHSPGLDVVGPYLSRMFERAFARPQQGLTRPLPHEWRVALVAAKRSVITCTLDGSHKYLSSGGACPWCAIEQRGGPAFFTSIAVTFSFDGNFNLAFTWRGINAVRQPPSASDLNVPNPPRNVLPTPLPAGADWKHLGDTLELPPLPGCPLEPLPELPIFEPDALPDDPPFLPEPLPPAPVWVERDLVAKVTRSYEQSLKFGDYRTAKWGTLCAAAITLVLLYLFPLAALPAGLFVLPFAITWAVYFFPRRSAFRREKAQAADEMRQRRLRHQEKVRHFEKTRAEVEVFNNELKEDWQQQVDKLNRLRAELPARNAAKHEAWQRDLMRVQQRRAEIELANARKRAAWEAEMRAHAALKLQVETHNAKVAAAKAERARVRNDRLSRWHKLLDDLEQAIRAWSLEAAALAAERTATHGRLTQAKNEYDALKTAFEAERRRLEVAAIQLQLDDYLENIFIEDHRIRDIGATRTATLAAYGIETANDCTEDALSHVPGFGPTLIAALLRWKEDQIARFVFDPQKAIPPTALRSLHMRFHSRRVALQRELSGGTERLQDVASRGEQRLAAVRQQVATLVKDVAQADADYSIC